MIYEACLCLNPKHHRCVTKWLKQSGIYVHIEEKLAGLLRRCRESAGLPAPFAAVGELHCERVKWWTIQKVVGQAAEAKQDVLPESKVVNYSSKSVLIDI